MMAPAMVKEDQNVISQVDIDVYRKLLLGDERSTPYELAWGLFYYTKDVLGYNLITEEHHWPLCYFLCSGGDAGEGHDIYNLIIAPRTSFKTTITTIAGPVWRALRAHYVFHRADYGVLITSETLGNAESFLRLIRWHFIHNPKFKLIFGDVRPDEVGWTERYIRFKWNREVSIDTSGVDNSRTSRHYPARVNDDMQTEKSFTPGEKKKVRDSYNALQKLFYPGNIREDNVGTPYFTDDIIAGLREGEFGKMRIYRRSALIDAEGRPTNQYEWDAKREKLILPKGVRLWFPQHLSLDKLERERKGSGARIFASQYLCEPIAAGEQEFDCDWFVMYDKLPEGKVFNCYILADWGGERSGNHYTAIVVIYVDAGGTFYIQDGVSGNFLAPLAISELFRLIRDNATHPMIREITLATEHTTFQTLYEGEVRRRKVKEGLRFRIVPLKPHGDHKEARIRSVQPIAEQGRIWVNRHIGEKMEDGLGKFTQEILREWREFPAGKFDDCIDATGYITRQGLIRAPYQPAPIRDEEDEFDLDAYYREKTRRELREIPGASRRRVSPIGIGGNF